MPLLGFQLLDVLAVCRPLSLDQNVDQSDGEHSTSHCDVNCVHIYIVFRFA